MIKGSYNNLVTFFVIFATIFSMACCQDMAYSCIVDEDKRLCLSALPCKSGTLNCNMAWQNCGACRQPEDDWKDFCEVKHKGRSVYYDYTNVANDGICQEWVPETKHSV